MTTTRESQENGGPQENDVAKPIDKAQYLVCIVLAAVGAFLIYNALTLEAGFAKVDPVGPRLFPMVVGIAAVVLAVALAIASRADPGARRMPARTSIRSHRVTGAPSDFWWRCSLR
jgi:hypothetical protein